MRYVRTSARVTPEMAIEYTKQAGLVCSPHNDEVNLAVLAETGILVLDFNTGIYYTANEEYVAKDYFSVVSEEEVLKKFSKVEVSLTRGDLQVIWDLTNEELDALWKPDGTHRDERYTKIEKLNILVDELLD